MIVIGVDPDSKAHGIAIFENEKLVALHSFQLFELFDWLNENVSDKSGVIFSIEDTLATNTIYAKNRQAGKEAQSKVGIHIGRCQQAQVELERMLARLGYGVTKSRPSRSDWKNNGAMFERVTGWTKRSNPDTRSAAYFGWILASKGAFRLNNGRSI